MIAPKDSVNGETSPVPSDSAGQGDGSSSGYQFPNSRRVYVLGEIHPDIRVPFREIALAPTKTVNGQIESNEPVRVYDTGGPWGDASVHCDVEQGLPALREQWILGRNDVEQIDGRTVTPVDDGYLSALHAESARSN